MELEILFMYLRNTTDNNFKLIVWCLQNIIPQIFVLEHIHYARWLTVHIGQLLSLEVENSEIFGSFALGSFTISTSRLESKFATDQARKENNKLFN